MAKLGFEKDCNNVNDDNSNNNYNGCVFVNGILKVIFVYVVVCCLTGPPPAHPNCSLHASLFSSILRGLFFLHF